MPKAANLVPQTEIARLLGVDVRSVRRFHRGDDPIPTHRRGQEVLYPDASCVRWWVEYQIARALAVQPSPELDQMRERREEAAARKLAAEASLAEIELARSRAELVPVATFRAHVEQIASTLRAQLLSVPGRYAARTIALESLVESQRVWDLAIRGVLAELSGEGVAAPEQDAE